MLYRITLLNRLRVLFSDFRFLAAMVILPLALSAITGNALNRQQKADMPLLVVDLDDTASSRELVAALASKDGLSVRLVEAGEAARSVEDNQVEAALTIPSGYGMQIRKGSVENLLKLSAASSADSRGFLTELIAGEVFRLSGDVFAWEVVQESLKREGLNIPVDAKAQVLLAYHRLVEKNWLEVSYEVISAEPPEGGGIINYPPVVASSLGLLVLFLLFGTLFGAGWLVEDRRNGTLARLISARGISVSWFLGNWTSLFAVGLFLAIMLVGGSALLAGIPPVSGLPAWLLILSYLACLASLGMALSTLFQTAARLQAATPAIAILSGFAGGCLWNRMGTVGNLPYIALATPQGWILQALGALYANPSDTGWLRSVSVLMGSSVVLSAFSWYRLRRNATSKG